jgi:PleD family two-component response regulator
MGCPRLANERTRAPSGSSSSLLAGTLEAATTWPSLLISGAATARVLLRVDDDPGVRRLSELVLKTAGYIVTVAENGIQALEMMDRRRPRPSFWTCRWQSWMDGPIPEA